MTRIRFSISIISVSVLLILSSCGKSGGGSTAPSTGTDDKNKVISFNPSKIPVSNSVYIEKISSINDEITLAVKVKNGVDVYGAAMEITYDGSKVSYVNITRGDYLGTESDTFFNAKLYKGQEGIILTGIYKIGNVPGVNGDGTLLTIVFRAGTTQTNTTIGFNVANSILNSSITGNTDIPGTSWIGGDLSYQ